MPTLAARLRAVGIFSDEYEVAVKLFKGPDKSLGMREQEATAIKRCLAESLSQRPRDGLLLVDNKDADALVLTSRLYGERFVSDVLMPVCKMVIANMDFIASLIPKLCKESQSGWLSRFTFRHFTAEVIDLLTQAIRDHCGSKGKDDPKAAGFQPSTASAYSSLYTNKYRRPMSLKVFITLLHQCGQLELFASVTQLLLPLREISSRSSMGDHTELLIPILESLSSEAINNPNTRQHYQVLFQEVLQSYVQKYISSKPPKPRDWTRKKRQNRSCSCRDCSSLDNFLVAPDQSEWRLKAAEPGRKHIDWQLYYLDCGTFTDRSQGTPYTLVVQKNQDAYDRAFREWERKCRSAKETFDRLGQEKLQSMLSKGFEEMIDHLSSAASGNRATFERQPLAPLAGANANKKRAYGGEVDNEPASKRVKGAEIIDLCGLEV